MFIKKSTSYGRLKSSITVPCINICVFDVYMVNNSWYHPRIYIYFLRITTLGGIFDIYFLKIASCWIVGAVFERNPDYEVVWRINESLSSISVKINTTSWYKNYKKVNKAWKFTPRNDFKIEHCILLLYICR